MHSRSGLDLSEVLEVLDIPMRSFRRWKAEMEEGVASPRINGRPRAARPTPEEVLAVRHCALRHPNMGYKRLTALMLWKGVAALRAYQVHEILQEAGLLARGRKTAPGALNRPEPPTRPDEVWHLDLMYLRVGGRWFYLVDILDGYSRYLVHWSLNPTMLTSTVTLTVQEALEKLGSRRDGEPKLIHDHGSQFVSAEWKGFVSGVGSQDIRTRVAHPESNGKLERLHRTHREEGLAGEALEDYLSALLALEDWATYYNEKRPHSALRYLPPAVYYRGDPVQALAERERRLAEATARREEYWRR